MRRLNPIWVVAIAVLALFSTACGGGGLQITRASVLGASYDEPTKSTRVRLTFEVWDGQQQLTTLPRESFSIYEDGRPATSESLNEANTQEKRVPVVLLLDTSLSMYQANAVGALKRAAIAFARGLESSGFQVTTYRFAGEIQRVNRIEEIPETFDPATGDRWTSLYAAVGEGFADEEAIVVVFSDGADNYSQNKGVEGLGEIEQHVLPAELGGTGEQRVVHTIAFGNVATESDVQGVPAQQALARLSRNGTSQYAQDPGAFERVFQDVANRIRNVYVYEYFSPNLQGTHTIVVEARVGTATARSPMLRFTAGGAEDSATGDTVERCVAGNEAACIKVGEAAVVSGNYDDLRRVLDRTCMPDSQHPMMCVGLIGGVIKSGKQDTIVPVATELCEQGKSFACIGAAAALAVSGDPTTGRSLLQKGCAEIPEGEIRQQFCSMVPPKAQPKAAPTPAELDAKCNAGTGAACTQLGLIYRDGLSGAQQNQTAAYEAFRKGCDSGETESCIAAARALSAGQGVAKDAKRGATLLQRWCDEGRLNACGYLGNLQVLGEGVPQNREQGLRRLRTACSKGHAPSCKLLESHGEQP